MGMKRKIRRLFSQGQANVLPQIKLQVHEPEQEKYIETKYKKLKYQVVLFSLAATVCFIGSLGSVLSWLFSPIYKFTTADCVNNFWKSENFVLALLFFCLFTACLLLLIIKIKKLKKNR